MTSASIAQVSLPPSGAVEGSGLSPRLTLKPQAATTGFVDGAWWPRSRDLTAELPPLLAVLAVRLGRVERVSYHLTDWDPPPGTIHLADGAVRLGGFRLQRADTLDVLAEHQRLTLLVVAPETSPHTAHRALRVAGQAGNTDSPTDLLAGTAQPTMTVLAPTRRQATEAMADVQCWEDEGGAGYDRADHQPPPVTAVRPRGRFAPAPVIRSRSSWTDRRKTVTP